MKMYYFPVRMKTWKDSIEMYRFNPESDSIGFIEVFDSVEKLKIAYGENVEYHALQKKEIE